MRAALLMSLAVLAVAPGAWGQDVACSTLPNGLRLVVRQDHGTDLVAVDLLLDVSVLDEQPSQSGIRYLVQRLLLRGTESQSGDDMAAALSAVGGVADTAVGLDYVEMYALVPADGFDVAVALIADAVRHPAFAPHEVEKEREAAIEAARGARDDAFQEGYLALRGGLYGEHPYARATFGSPETLSAISRQNLLEFHQGCYRPERAVLAVSGAVQESRARRVVVREFGTWQAGSSPARRHWPVLPLAQSEIQAREAPTGQVHLMFGFQAPAAGEPGYYAVQLLDSILSGGSAARLQRVLREDLGLVYNVSSFYPTLARPSHLVIYAATDVRSVDAVKAAIVDLLRRLREEPVEPSELARAKRYLLGSYALGHQRLRDQAYSLAWYEVLGLGSGFEQQYRAGIEAVTAEDLQGAAQEFLGRFVLAVVFPRA